MTMSYNASTGVITLTTSSTAFNSSYTCKVNVYITEQPPEIPKTAQTKTASPSTTTQIVIPDSGCELTSVEVEPVTSGLLTSLDPDFKASNIRAGINILGLVGTLNPEGGSFDPSPWTDVEVGQITPSSAQSTLAVDTSRGTPRGLIISLANKNGVSQTTNCLINASWASSPAQSVYARSVCYATSYSTSQTTSYPGQTIAYITNQSLVITNAEIRYRLSLGTAARGWFDFIPRENGNLSIQWRDPTQ